MAKLPFLYFSGSHLPPEQAFETWRALMAPMYDVLPGSGADRQPSGGTLAYVLDDILVNRTVFTAQHVVRDRKRADNTPDHMLFHFWRTGGYAGEIGHQAVDYSAGIVALSDRRRTFDVRFAPADTIGLIVPRAHFAGLDLEKLGTRSDPVRNRLLRARILALYRRLPHVSQADAPALKAEVIGFLRRILDPSAAADVLEGPELDHGLAAQAEWHILAHLGQADLGPETIAAALGISRSTLYRLFAGSGGVMHHVQEQRLRAVRNALRDPIEQRTISRLAAEFGLKSLPYLSRTFRARFDMSPRAWRDQNRERLLALRQHSHESFWRCFYGLGRT